MPDPPAPPAIPRLQPRGPASLRYKSNPLLADLGSMAMADMWFKSLYSACILQVGKAIRTAECDCTCLLGLSC